MLIVPATRRQLSPRKKRVQIERKQSSIFQFTFSTASSLSRCSSYKQQQQEHPLYRRSFLPCLCPMSSPSHVSLFFSFSNQLVKRAKPHLGGHLPSFRGTDIPLYLYIIDRLSSVFPPQILLLLLLLLWLPVQVGPASAASKKTRKHHFAASESNAGAERENS